MLKTLKSFFATKPLNTEAVSDSKLRTIDIAYAALLVEVIKSDHEIDERESKKLLEILNNKLSSNYGDLSEIVAIAEEKSDESTSLYEFTRLINDEYDYQKKVTLIENMWAIAFADEEIDRYEEYLIRKISDLTYVSHSDFIKSKLKARKNQRL